MKTSSRGEGAAMISWEENLHAEDARLAALLSELVNSRGPVPASALIARIPGYYQDIASAGEHLGTDVDRLSALGLEIDTGTADDEAYLALSSRSWESRPLDLNESDRAILQKAIELNAPLSPELAAAVAALDATEPPLASDTTVSLSPRTAIGSGRAAVFSRLHRFAGQMAAGIVSGFGYPDDTGGMAEWGIEIYGLGESRGVWYAVGAEPDSDVIRAFQVARVRGPVADLTPEGAYVIPRSFEVAQYVALGWRLGPNPVPAHVWFGASLAPFMRTALQDSPLGELPDGSLEASLEVGDMQRFVDWILTFGTHARIIAPQTAVDLAIATLQEMAAHNE